MQEGDACGLLNGDGRGVQQRCAAQTTSAGVEAELGGAVGRGQESPLRIAPSVGIARGEKMD